MIILIGPLPHLTLTHAHTRPHRLTSSGIPFCPESPWVLVKQGKLDQAKKSLKRLYGRTEDDLDMHLKVIQDTLEFESRLHASSRWIDLFRYVISAGAAREREQNVKLTFLAEAATSAEHSLSCSSIFASRSRVYNLHLDSRPTFSNSLGSRLVMPFLSISDHCP